MKDKENKINNPDSQGSLDDPRKELEKSEKRLDHLERELIQAEKKLETSDNLSKEKESLLKVFKKGKREIKDLKSQIDTLTSHIYEIEYYSNSRRSFKQRLISRFPTLYLLFNRNNQGIKNAFINIKGYNAIKRHQLFDTGYYLKNNVDVRLSGVDPLIHYLYFGFKEGRKPDPSFDGDYYLRTYQDVKDLNINPLVHYSLYGINEGRKTFKSSNVNKFPSKYREHLENKHFVSVIMPTYNRRDVIGRAIDSVLDQTFRNFELIIVDDGSTDDTQSLIITDYGEHLKSGKIKYFLQKNCGVSSARNRGLSESLGDVIAYLDSDNYWHDTYLEKMVFALSDNDKNTAYASVEVTDNYRNRKFTRNTEYDRNKLLKGSYIDLNVFVHKKFLYHQLGGFNESLTRLVDWDLILRYTRLNEPYFVDEVLAQYFSSSELNNISNTIDLDENRLKVQKLYRDEIIGRGIDDLRIGYVLWDFPSFSQTFVMNELRWLVEHNYDVKVFYKVAPDKEAELDFNIEAVKLKNSSDLVKKIEEHNINMLHSHFVFPACTRLTYPAAEKAGVPFTVFAHAIDIFHKKNDKRNKVEEIGNSRYCKRVFVLGKYHYDYLKERGVPEEKLMFLRQATSYHLERGVSIDSPRFNRKIKNIITLARFVEKKGIDALIKAAHILKGEDLAFKIYGYGPLEKDLQKLINKLNLTNVTMEGPLKGDEALKKAYEDGDLFVLPCRVASDGDRDGMPTVIFEAMAYGVPVITTNVSAIPEFVSDVYSGFIVDPDNPEALSDKIQQVRSMDKDDLFTITRHAQNQVQKLSSVEDTTKTILDIWNNYRIDIFMVTHQRGRYKDLETMKEILDRIFKYTRMEFDLTIVDNDSDQESKDFLQEYAQSHPNIRLIFLKENIFCGPASNVALEAMDNEFTIYLCSNEAFVLKQGWELKAVEYMRNHEDVAIAGDLAYSPGYYNGETYKAQKFFEKFRNKEHIESKDNIKFKHVQGGIYILRRDAHLKSGGFNPLLPQDHMDVEYSYYLQSEGWKLGEIPGWISQSVKTLPKFNTHLDENTAAVHPLKLKEAGNIETMALDNCNICNSKLVDDICSECKSDGSQRAIYRIIGETDKPYRSLKCTLLLKNNSVHGVFRKMFSLTRHSTKSVTEDLEGVLGSLENTDVLIVNTGLDHSNYGKILEVMMERLNGDGLLVLELGYDQLLNDKLKNSLNDDDKLKVGIKEFTPHKLSNDEFILVNKVK